MKAIDPDELYSFSEARKFIRSVRGGCLSLSSLHRWRVKGLFTAQRRTIGGHIQWFVHGREVLRLLESMTETVPASKVAHVPTATEVANEQAWAMDFLRREGVLK